MRIWILSLLATTLIWWFPNSISAEGNLASRATRLPDMMIDSGELTLSISQFELETGKYYRWRIVHDGGEEFQILAPDLFRNSWIGQVVIEELEVKLQDAKAKIVVSKIIMYLFVIAEFKLITN